MGPQTSTPPETPDDGISPVVGAILMVAITVVLAAVILFFVTGLADQPQIASAGFQIEETSSGVEILLNSVGTADSITLVVDGTTLHTWDATDVGTSVTVTGVTTDSEISLVGENGGSSTVIQVVTPDRAHGTGAPALVPNTAPTPSGPSVLWEYSMASHHPVGGVALDGSGQAYAVGINTSYPYGDRARLHAINTGDGSQNWEQNPTVRTLLTPLYNDGTVYYIDRNDDVTAYDAATGTSQFTEPRDQRYGEHYVSDTYFVSDIAYGFSNQGIQVHDAATGTELYTTNYGQPVLVKSLDDASNRIYGYNYTPGIVEIEASSGTVITFHDLSGQLGANDAYVVDGTTVYGSDDTTLVKYDMSTNSLEWAVPITLTASSPGQMHVAGNALYYTDSNVLRVYSTTDGSQQYEVTLDSDVDDAIHADDGNIYATTDNTLYSLSDTDGSENWNMTFTAEIQGAPNIYNGVAYIAIADYVSGSTDGKIIAIDIGGSTTADTENCGRGFETGGFDC